eukprot:3685975-Rhodomonas_salina.1
MCIIRLGSHQRLELVQASGLGSRVSGVGFRAADRWSRIQTFMRDPDADMLQLRAQGSGFRDSGFGFGIPRPRIHVTGPYRQ